MLVSGTGNGSGGFMARLSAALGERSDMYGPPSVNMARTATILNAVFGERLRVPFTAEDVPLLQVCVKLARLMQPGADHTDSWLDIAGYASVADDVRTGDAPPPF